MTWAVGLVGKAACPGAAVAVAFVVLNSLQGLLIFVFHVLLSQRCRSRVSRELSSRGILTPSSRGAKGVGHSASYSSSKANRCDGIHV